MGGTNWLENKILSKGPINGRSSA